LVPRHLRSFRSVRNSSCGRSGVGRLSGLVRANKMDSSKSSEDFLVLVLYPGVQITPQSIHEQGRALRHHGDGLSEILQPKIADFDPVNEDPALCLEGSKVGEDN